ncbi:acyl carrier protein [Gottschalkiaceae bacterium SANA]|nr:acyl carrier protein [Gottschalkiaceae bacterium SANA]
MMEKLKAILVEELDVEMEAVTLEANFKEDLEADSLDMMQLVMEIEEEFEIEVETEELATILTVGDLVAYIEKKQA